MTSDLKAAYDVAVIGAGPAGLAAASVAANCGLSTVLFDDNAGPGGQIYRAVTSTPLSGERVLDRDFWEGRDLVLDLEDLQAQYVPRATVWNLSSDREIGVSVGSTATMLQAQRVIIATGAMERPFPIPGWTLPGVMTVGAAQTVLKASALVPDGRVVMAGSGPLLWLCAYQLLKAGCSLQAILDTTDAGYRRDAMRHVPQFLRSHYLAKGLRLMAYVRRKVRVISRVTSISAHGDGALEGISYSVSGRGTERMPVDHLLLHHGVIPNVNLAMSANVPHEWDSVQLCWRPKVDSFGNTGIDGIAIAGDGAGIGGGWAAAQRGRLAAISAVRALDPLRTGLPDELAIRRDLDLAMRGRGFIDRLYRPPRAFRIPADETIVCRCEEITAGQVREAVAMGAQGPNQLKAFLRCGMGPCQGRLCGTTITEVIADARKVPPAEVGHYRLRPPVKPITLAELAGLPQTEAARKSVVRL